MNDVLGMPRRAVVLSATSDLARALLRELVARGLEEVLLTGRDLAALEEVRGELDSLGVKQVETVLVDLRDPDLGDTLAAVVARAGRVDLLVVASGLLGSGELHDLEPRQLAEVTQVNFSGPALALGAFCRHLIEQGEGQVVVFSSATVARVRRANFVYGAAKAGLDAFCQGLQDALVGTGVRLMIVRPGFVPTKMTKGMRAMPFATTTQKVTDAVIRGLEQRSEVVWVPAQLRVLTAIARLLPRRLWRALPQ